MFSNPGPGGYAAVCELKGKKLAAKGCSTKITTNNAMELMAAVKGLESCKIKCNVTFYTDSNYLVTCAGHSREWLTAPERKNRDLWMQLLKTAEKGGHTYKFVKVDGHSGVALNELADKLARAECKKARHLLNESR